MCLGLSLAAGGCKNVESFFNDVGNSVDGAATEVVDGTRRVFTGEKRPPRELPEAEGEGAEDEAFVRSREAYDKGKVAYELAEYDEAIEQFSASFVAAEEIEDESMRAIVQSTLHYNLGQAHLHAYDIDRDPTHLHKSKDLLDKYLAANPELSDEDRELTETLKAEADAKLETHAQGQAEGVSGPSGATGGA